MDLEFKKCWIERH